MGTTEEMVGRIEIRTLMHDMITEAAAMEDALAWIDANGYRLVRTGPGYILVAKREAKKKR